MTEISDNYIENLLVRCVAIATSTWSDALDQLELAGVIQGLQHRSGIGRIAGRAVTVKEVTGELGDHLLEDFNVGAILAAGGAGEILIIDMGGYEISTFGGLAARAATNRNITGVLIEGGCRDLDEIRATGLWLGSRHVTPLSGKRRAKVTGINIPIYIDGVEINPGDYIVADTTGSIVIPAGRIEQVLEIAEELTARDMQFEDALKQGQQFGAIAQTLKHM
ncbi:MAG: RraA family protein [Chloroflexi bacterium]|uniref:Putative 4-hydroxy-4-methyl-2-oxoglutarate aldolase n=1 Tax=Candidatus Chlorohelix allophototropha TaxID=3003348 RepID=A0A8T7LXI8_9CHLR|nr:RraA family protein [Chloroflexota bacterium]WJW66044.1 hypothetical protein OZ401_001826 [Chloroflexota bacterium L227-S17]